MTKVDKILLQMKQNPKNDWVIEDLKRIAQQYDIQSRQPGGSHLTFRSKEGI